MELLDCKAHFSGMSQFHILGSEDIVTSPLGFSFKIPMMPQPIYVGSNPHLEFTQWIAYRFLKMRPIWPSSYLPSATFLYFSISLSRLRTKFVNSGFLILVFSFLKRPLFAFFRSEKMDNLSGHFGDACCDHISIDLPVSVVACFVFNLADKRTDP